MDSFPEWFGSFLALCVVIAPIVAILALGAWLSRVLDGSSWINRFRKRRVKHETVDAKHLARMQERALEDDDESGK